MKYFKNNVINRTNSNHLIVVKLIVFTSSFPFLQEYILFTPMKTNHQSHHLADGFKDFNPAVLAT